MGGFIQALCQGSTTFLVVQGVLENTGGHFQAIFHVKFCESLEDVSLTMSLFSHCWMQSEQICTNLGHSILSF